MYRHLTVAISAQCTYRNRFMVAENAVSPIDQLEPEVAGQVQARKLTVKMYPKETSMGQEADEEW
jgi:hypothetical protein